MRCGWDEKCQPLVNSDEWPKSPAAYSRFYNQEMSDGPMVKGLGFHYHYMALYYHAVDALAYHARKFNSDIEFADTELNFIRAMLPARHALYNQFCQVLSVDPKAPASEVVKKLFENNSVGNLIHNGGAIKMFKTLKQLALRSFFIDPRHRYKLSIEILIFFRYDFHLFKQAFFSLDFRPFDMINNAGWKEKPFFMWQMEKFVFTAEGRLFLALTLDTFPSLLVHTFNDELLTPNQMSYTSSHLYYVPHTLLRFYMGIQQKGRFDKDLIE